MVIDGKERQAVGMWPQWRWNDPPDLALLARSPHFAIPSECITNTLFSAVMIGVLSSRLGERGKGLATYI